MFCRCQANTDADEFKTPAAIVQPRKNSRSHQVPKNGDLPTKNDPAERQDEFLKGKTRSLNDLAAAEECRAVRHIHVCHCLPATGNKENWVNKEKNKENWGNKENWDVCPTCRDNQTAKLLANKAATNRKSKAWK